MKNYFLTALAVCALLSSCKKKDNQNCESTIAALTGKYKITSDKVAGVETISTTMPNCEKDDIYFLKADKTVEYTDAGTACNQPVVNGTGTWDVVNGVLTITMSGAGTGESYIGTVTNKCNSFELVESLLETPVLGGVHTLTFTKQ